jgi:hypothetical protein
MSLISVGQKPRLVVRQRLKRRRPMSDFNRKVDTPNGPGYAFGKLPNGKIMVSHNWNSLDEKFRLSYKGAPAKIIMQIYEREDIHV